MTIDGQAVSTHDHNREAHPLCNTSDKLAPRGADTATTDTVAPLIVGQRRAAPGGVILRGDLSQLAAVPSAESRNLRTRDDPVLGSSARISM